MKKHLLIGVAKFESPLSVVVLWRCLLALALLGMLHGVMIDDAVAIDPPHTNDCMSCHMIHGGFGGGLFNPGALLKSDSNDNLCTTCHTPGGPATGKPFTDVDQAYPSTTGTSHRWDSGASGHTEADLANTSPGIMYSGGAYTGRIETDYTITISTPGDVGVARFDWTNNGGLSVTDTVRDEFSAQSYGNNDGTVNWVGNWIENDPQGGGAASGKAQVTGGELRMDQQGFSGFGVSAAREVDLSGGVSNATFSFDFRTGSGVDATDAVAIEVSNNGGGSYDWVLDTITGIVGASSGSRSYPIQAYAAVNTRVRFRISNLYAGANEYLYVDNAQVEYTAPGGGSSGSNVLTGTDVPLADGLTMSFLDGGTSPSFVLGDIWTLYVRTDLRSPDLGVPAEFDLAARLDLAGKVVCSTCHNQHSQAMQPFDPLAPAYGGRGTGAGRHYQRADNDTNQICTVCHSPRDVQDGDLGSHPVGVMVPGGDYQAPATLPLDTGSNVVCMSCHDIHYTDSGGANAGAGDGYLLRQDMGALCYECHTLADQPNGSHFDAVSGALWPGGQYGSSFPAHTADKRSQCINCHWPHGWPDDTNLTEDYADLKVEKESDLCSTCHDGNPVTPNLVAEFSKGSNHPLGLSDSAHASDEATLVNSPDRHVECQDCHNPHQAKPRVSLPGPMVSPRPASGPLSEIRGIDTAGNPVDPASYEYQLCFRCHGDSTGKPAAPTPRQFPSTNVREEFNGSMASFHSVAVTGTLNTRLPSLRAGWTNASYVTCTSCHNNNDGPNNGAGGTGPNGPHGSNYDNLLERRFETSDPQTYSQAKYALCFKCHDPNSILNDESFDKHKKHIEGEEAPCTVCHDPHGSSGQKKLINFDTSVVFPSGGRLEFIAPEDNGGKGECYLVCHGKDHDPKDY